VRIGWSGTVEYGLQWPAISDEEFAESHARASDHPETAATWKGMAREAGFKQADARLSISTLTD
jgi:hypothetical protein